MIFLIDIGNTRIKWAIYSEGKIEPQDSYYYNNDNYLEIINNLVGTWGDLSPSRVLVSNVGPTELLEEIDTAVWDILEIEAEHLKSSRSYQGLINSYQKADTLGIDRWLSLVGAYKSKIEKNTAFCVIDCGTAITVDAVDDKGKHLGGFIIPGLNLMEQSLINSASKVQDNLNQSNLVNNISKLRRPAKENYFLANNTKFGIVGGIYYTVISYIENIISDLNLILNDNYKIFMTGGDARKIKAMLKTSGGNIELEDDLIWHGMINMI